MTTHALVSPIAAEAPSDLLQAFFDRVRSSNPFTDNRVNSPTPDDVDVGDIHRQAFERLTALAREARDQRRGIGVMLWGEAGIGKSHLLSRLVRWAEGDGQACAVYLHNLQASPENLPRSLLKAVISILTRGWVRGFTQTPLFDLVFALISEALAHDRTTKHPWPQIERAYQGLLDRMSAAEPSRAALVDRTVYAVLYHFFHSSYRAHKTHDERIAALAVRWLSGDYLDPDEAKLLGLPPGPGRDEPVALADNQQIKQVLTALTRLALSRGQPFLLCFDQVDNLEENQAAALFRFLEALIDSSPNLLVVTAGVQATLLAWRARIIQESAWHRLAQFEVSLQRLSPDESRRIIAARVEKFVRPFVEEDALRQQRQDDPLFPLGRLWADAFFQGKIDVRPREAINGARAGWQQQQEILRQLGGPAWLEQWGRQPAVTNGKAPPSEPTEEMIRTAIDRKVTQKIEEHCEQRRQRPDSLPPDADHLAGLVAALLKQIAGGSPHALHIDVPPSGKPHKQFPYSLVIRQPSAANGQAARTGLLFLATDSAFSTTANLGWLIGDTHHPERKLLITEARLPLAFGAQSDAKGRKYYAELTQGKYGHFQHVQLTFEQYARLDALRAVAGIARAGDLEIELPGGQSRPVSEQEVVESHHRQGRYQAATLLSDILDNPSRSHAPRGNASPDALRPEPASADASRQP